VYRSVVRRGSYQFGAAAWTPSAGYIFYQIPGQHDVAKIFVNTEAGETTLKIGTQTLMNLAERSHSGHI